MARSYWRRQFATTLRLGRAGRGAEVVVAVRDVLRVALVGLVLSVGVGWSLGSPALAGASLSSAAYQVGANPQLVMGFEPGDPLTENAVNGGQLKEFRIVSDDVKQGEGAAEVTFDVSDPSQSWSGVRVVQEFAKPLDLYGYSKLGLWVKGDGQHHSLIIDFSDGTVEGSIWFDFDHSGWHHFVFDLSQHPNRWQLDRLNWTAIRSIFLEFADGAGSLKNKGTVILDELVMAK